MPADTHTRGQAIALGLHRYFTGKACRRGHVTWRFTSTGACGACCGVYRREGRGRKAGGLVAVRIMAHPDDARQLTALAVAMALDRAMGTLK